VERLLTVTYIWIRRCAVALVGGTVVLIGIVMIVAPGPAFVVIPAGLAILGLEFACARRWLHELRTRGASVFGEARTRLRTRTWLRTRDGTRHEPMRDEPLMPTTPLQDSRTYVQTALVRKSATSQKASTNKSY
jgi:hypothetical protein